MTTELQFLTKAPQLARHPDTTCACIGGIETA